VRVLAASQAADAAAVSTIQEGQPSFAPEQYPGTHEGPLQANAAGLAQPEAWWLQAGEGQQRVTHYSEGLLLGNPNNPKPNPNPPPHPPPLTPTPTLTLSPNPNPDPKPRPSPSPDPIQATAGSTPRTSPPPLPSATVSATRA
jgi:hypothetical protein